MNPRYIWALLVLVGIVVLGFIFWPKNNSLPSEEKTVLNPVIKLEGGTQATYTSSINSEPTKIVSGSYLQTPTTIELGLDTRATIYFGDGSEARMKEGSKMSLNNATYSKTTEDLNVDITLEEGHVWSKIIELATPASSWEVKTSNTVATVRGTAFDVAVKSGKTFVITTNNKVGLTVVDPTSKKVLAMNVALVEEGKMLEIGDKEVEMLTKEPKAELKPFDSTDEFTKSDWATTNIRVDVDLDRRVEEFKKEGLKGEGLRERLRDVNASAPEESSVKVEIGGVKNIENLPVISDETSENTKPQVRVIEPVVQKPLPVREQIKKLAEPIRIEVDSLTPYAELMEGQIHAFRATLFRADGTKEDVTLKATWQAVGNIGSFVGPGKFVGKLDEQGQELGERTGTVAATWSDSVTDEGFLDKSPMFKVKFNPDSLDGRAI